MLIALVGPDRFSVADALKRYLAKYASSEEGLGDLNLVRLDGARLVPDELERAVQSMGFFSETRVVVVEGLLTRFGGGKAAAAEGDDQPKAEVPAKGRGRAEPGLVDGFATVFGSVPDTTVLILVDRGTV